MPYAIPQNVHYEEKILGPFTLKESVYVGIGGGIALYVYLMETMPMPAKVMIIGVVGLITIGFAKFNLDRLIKNYFNFFRAKKTLSWLSPAAREIMGIKSIKGNSVYLKDGRILGVIRVKPINFAVMSEQDRDMVIYGFLNFLNALTYPIQIAMRSVNLDLDDYLRHIKRKISKRDDKVALAYFEHFEDYMKQYISQNKICDRLFYIIVPGEVKGDEKLIIENLETRCENIQATLSLSGIISDRLTKGQLTNFYSSYFTETFEIAESFISPITMYRMMWKESPQHMRERRLKEAKARASGKTEQPKEEAPAQKA
ncbi:MAG: PrgI family protein [Methanobacteriota archaeon]